LKTIFPKGIDKIKPVIFLTAGLTIVTIALIVNFYFTDKNLSVGYRPEQPIPFSHKLHAGEMGMDCRYCHINVEKSPHASVPHSDVCWNCHSKVKTDSPKLQLLASIQKDTITRKNIIDHKFDTKTPKVVEEEVENPNKGAAIPWIKIHKLPEYAYFDHSVHVRAGVSCVECHGRIDQMEVVKQVSSLSMGWCLECHKDHEDHIRPDSVRITDLAWTWENSNLNKEEELKKIKETKNLNPPIIGCSPCHR